MGHQDYTMTPAPLPVHAFTEEEYLEFHKILSLEKFIPYSTAVLRAIMSDIETTHAFAVSPTETRIINHPSSCFVIGRSGTGKTTTMLFKLLGIEQAAHSSKYRQVFLTQSHVLAQRVQEYYEQLARAAELSHGTGHEDGHPGPVEQDLLHLDEEADDRSDLPKCFSNLADKHFPLFVTFDQVRRMLENDLNLSFSKHRTALRRQATRKMITEGGGISTLGINDHVNDDAEATASMVTVGRDNYVTFESFHRNYWPHIDQRLTKGLDPSLVYSEIMGVISGHEDTTKTEDGFLDRASYVSLSARAHSQFSTQRHRVYDIFEKYRKMKHGYGEYDSPDRTHAILRKLQQGISAKIDFLYVDEVQDLLTVDTKLLRELCANPRGLFWGGDTAQTISVGSSFRFEDLKALIWREERNDPLVKKGVREAVPSEVFELLVNYRSHGGIVDCAASLINLISSLFPYSIDKLQKECAVVSGPKPRIFRSDLVHFEEFLCDVGDTRMDFGARQVIIVRDDGAREELRRQLGDAGLILTLIESKGLEFDDVLLHDFFRSSPATATQWRVIATKSCDPIKHRVIESELKRLYVAVTRARHHCWIWDSSELAQPMINFWVTQNLVQVQDPSEDIPQLATQSTPEEWNTTGRYLFAKTLYVQAASCFAKANRDHDRRIAEAYQIRKEARVTNDILSFKEAGTAFSACASTAQGETAQGLYTRAAECFLQARETSLAADNYKAASEFTKAVQLYRKVGQFEDVASLLRPPDHSISLVDPGVADDMLDVVRMQFLRTDDIVRAGELFDTTDELLEYMDSWGFDTARKSVLKKLGNFASAAELHLRDGETLEAAECFTNLLIQAINNGQFPASSEDCGLKLSIMISLMRPRYCTRSSRPCLQDLFPMLLVQRRAFLRQSHTEICVIWLTSQGNMCPQTGFLPPYALTRFYELHFICKQVH
ncbi:hypothetical protein BS47DRAFT_108769 [Hydnum rufescens UP504]|uniref:UvrD-like helicase ATP-binding domain-containing protein n=1 Tax=Hydnum rufescens UP504 TaxID=1448309 RepID=A0A9P6DPF1_9AGAM|nr:hypothetical protein BS47DRAFT_108769 [Hydnum rufescens UP504]